LTASVAEVTAMDPDEDRKLADLSEVPADSTLLVTLRDGLDEVEAILTRLDGEVACWTDYCQHWTDVRLDKGSGAAVRDDEIICQKHGALFDTASGECTHGPCEGAFLDEIAVTVRDGAVYLAKDDYEFHHRGRASDVDRSTGSRIDFSGT
jgi:nitrite reductase/ring-hydroxylating ferredoxin subunit